MLNSFTTRFLPCSLSPNFYARNVKRGIMFGNKESLNFIEKKKINFIKRVL